MFCRLVCSLSLLLFPVSLMQAQVVIAGPPTVGSSNPVSPEPLVTRPVTVPCVVPLLTNEEFNDYNERTFTYTPPTGSGCSGPWAKVVFSADLTVTSGVQFDRSAQIYLNNVTIYRGTTSEPSPGFSPSWHVERDVTDLSATFYTAGSGIANIQNIVDSTYTGIIYANAELDFYPASDAVPAPVVPDMVIPIYQTDPSYYHETSAPLTESITLPQNTEALYLDLTAQTDEFWWLSTPNAQVAPLVQGVNSTAFREMDVSIDGTPAAVAPNHPYIFTGGIDPSLWLPITGAQTLNLKPYRVNLTPFVGTLTDGKPHVFVLNDINTIDEGSGGSLVNGDLLVYLDHGSTTVTGALVSNTLMAAPATTVTSQVNLDSNLNGSAEVSEALDRSFKISGYVNTSQGKVTTTIDETVNWSNAQLVDSGPTSEGLVDNLISTVDSTVTTEGPSGTTTAAYHTENPLQFYLSFIVNPDGSESETTLANLNDVYKQLGPSTFSSNAEEAVSSTDTIDFDASGNYLGNFGMASTGTYFSNDSLGNTYSSTLTAAANVLTGVTTGTSSTAVTMLVSATATKAVQGSTVTLNATVTPQNNVTKPTGYVTFYLAATPTPTVLGTVPVTAGVASLPLTTLPVGADAITASYSGDGTFVAVNGLNTVTVTVTALAPAITLGAFSPANMTLVAGQTGVLSLPITANASFSGAVTFACTGAPSETACVVTPGSVTLTAGQTATVSVTVATTAPNNTTTAENHLPGMTKALGGISFAGIFLLLIPRRKRRGMFTLIAVLALGLYATTGLTGCSNGNSGVKFPGTPAGTSTLTVTATAGAVTQTATFTLTVSQ
jgi:hypothetical protein